MKRTLVMCLLIVHFRRRTKCLISPGACWTDAGLYCFHGYWNKLDTNTSSTQNRSNWCKDRHFNQTNDEIFGYGPKTNKQLVDEVYHPSCISLLSVHILFYFLSS
jgi:hypothetical protein